MGAGWNIERAFRNSGWRDQKRQQRTIPKRARQMT
jgi:hypothetical protein